MKRFPRVRAVFAASIAAGLLAAGVPAIAQEGPVMSSRPGERTPRALPPPAGAEGIRLSLSEAVALAIANNQDLNVSVATAEASRYVLFSNMGIFDPLLEAEAIRSHDEQPASSALVGADVQERDTTDVSARVSQLTPWGGTFSLGFATNRTETNSTFFFVNPAWNTGLTI